MVINTKSRCPMCQEQVESAYFRDKAGNRTTLCARCQNLIAAFVPGRDGNKAKEILAKYGMSAEKIEDLVSPAEAADQVVMKVIGMDVFNNRIKPANVIPVSKLAREVIKAQFVLPRTDGDYKFGFTGMIGFDNAEQKVLATQEQQSRMIENQQRMKLDPPIENKEDDSFPGAIVNLKYLSRPSFRPLPDEYRPWNKTEAPPKPPEPPAKIGRVARAIAGEDEE